jgi:antirestriction protein ArdC
MLESHKQSNYSESWYNLSGDSIFAKNIASNHIYSGINQLMLNYLKQKNNYAFNRWLTFKQIEGFGGRIKKGSKAALVVYKSAIYLDAETEKNITKQVEYLLKNLQSIEHLKIKKVGYLKSFNVFNLSCVDGLPDEFYKLAEIDKLTDFEKDERAEELIKNFEVKIDFDARNEAFYKPSQDKIFMPMPKQFVSKDAFYSVIFHECGHATAHPTRLNRPILNKFGSKEYAFEELIAEINSAFICAYLGYESRITDNVSYIDNWLSVMKNDKRFVIQAASQAQQTSNFILNSAKVEEYVMVE